jgi:uncharacterized integral membrane protein
VRSATADPNAPPEPAAAGSAGPRGVDPIAFERRRGSLGVLLVAIGVIFLLGNVGALRFIDWHFVWPLVLIALGVFFIAQRARS